MRKYALADPAVRRRVEGSLRALGGYDERPEQSCTYRLDFSGGGERVAVKQYVNGTLFVQGAGPPGALFERVVGAIESGGAGDAPDGGAAGSGAGPGAGTSGTSGAGRAGRARRTSGAGVRAVPLGKPAPAVSRAPRGSSAGVDVVRPFDEPWIGSDESGKGDYFGPLVACAVWVDDRVVALLETLGVRDSKTLSDAHVRRLARDVRAVCGERCAEVVVPPERYNDLYAQFRAEGKNLNTLLAWGHVRAIETVLERVPCENVIVDQFADARYIAGRLVGRSRTGHLNVVQVPRAEANPAVAAASVLARDRFLAWLERASRSWGIALPKGASPAVEVSARRLIERHGAEALRKAAKLHFKTTARVLAPRGAA